MKRFVWSELSADERRAALARPRRRRDGEVSAIVRRIFDEVEAEGEAAVRRWSLALDKRAPQRLELTPNLVAAARAAVTSEDIAALDLAVANVRRFHEATKPASRDIEIQAGVRCRREWRAIGACGLYIPGGSAPLFSTLIMLAEPARVAGVRERIALTPPGAGEAPHPMMIAAAAACGLDALWLVGGAQAIAALSFGAGLPRAEKIFGPGNAYVTEAKRYAASLAGGPVIDVPAGPSELMVIADDAANARIVAADLLSQAEHDPDAQVILVATSETIVNAVAAELAKQTPSLPRAEIAQASLAQARLIRARDAAEAAEIANAYAPEHLSLQIAAPQALVPRLDNAGAVFVGAWSAETFGDYICGPSHVLPTDGAARAWSGVSVASFMKSFTVQEMNDIGARALAPGAARLARLEGLEAHARAADARLQ
ncbi:MAG: histidinol dehydrogenase [Caulobacterales bacterium]|jgi:histidinol dehydrogenase|nr:histidinol dehydrogenase [Caulobacterales bacterium]